MAELDELYQEILLEHGRRPHNFRKLEGANRRGNGFNPLCGDEVVLYLKVEDDTIVDVGFQGGGCAISRASASLMTEGIKGKSRAEVEELFRAFHQMITREPGKEFADDKLGDLETLSGVSEFPVRVKCATLAWQTLKAALEAREETASTE